jgi:hypothetical protein
LGVCFLGLELKNICENIKNQTQKGVFESQVFQNRDPGFSSFSSYQLRGFVFLSLGVRFIKVI